MYIKCYRKARLNSVVDLSREIVKPTLVTNYTSQAIRHISFYSYPLPKQPLYAVVYAEILAVATHCQQINIRFHSKVGGIGYMSQLTAMSYKHLKADSHQWGTVDTNITE